MMTLESAIKHCEEVAKEQEKMAKEWHENQVRKCELIHFAEMDYTRENECKECAEEHKQLAEWLKCLAKIADMLDGTIDHLSGDDAKELLSDIKWELKLVKLTEV